MLDRKHRTLESSGTTLDKNAKYHGGSIYIFKDRLAATFVGIAIVDEKPDNEEHYYWTQRKQ